MAYNTNNPLGSKDPKDLYDNATNFDYYANGPDPMYPNRFGALKLSIEGMNQQFNDAQLGRAAIFQDFLDRSNYTYIGEYGAGLLFTSRSQYFVRNGVMYVPDNDLTLPYTTTGVWASEASLFKVLADDATLRQDLLAASGADRVGYGAGETYAAGTVGEALQDLEEKTENILVYANNLTEETAAFAAGATLVVRLDLLTPAPVTNYVLDASYIPTSVNAASGLRQTSAAGGYTENGFSFNAVTTGPMARIHAFIYLDSGTPADLIAEVRPDVSGSPGTAVLAAVGIPAFSTPNSLVGLLSSPRIIDLSGITQIAGTKYWVTFRPANAAGNAYYGVASFTGAGTTANGVTRAASSGAWTAITGNIQTPYRTYTLG